MTDISDAICVGVVVGLVTAAFSGVISYFVMFLLDKRRRKLDDADRKSKRDRDLRSALVFILKELEAAKESPAISNDRSKTWPPLLASGLDLLRTKGPLDLLPNELLSYTLTAYAYLHRINHFIMQYPDDAHASSINLKNHIGRVQMPCLKAIEKCISAIEKRLPERMPTRAIDATMGPSAT